MVRATHTSGSGNYGAMVGRNYRRKPKLTEKDQLHFIHHKFHMKEPEAQR
jgi:hypothetical protein